MIHKKIALFLCLLIFSISTIACTKQTSVVIDTIIITDILNREVRVKLNASRFVCLGPNSLRLYTYIANIENIVGIENFEIIQTPKGRPYIELYQDKILSLPIISEGGPKSTPNSENILLVNPDVIIMSSYYDLNVIENIANTTNIPVIVISNDTSEGTIFNDALFKSLEILGEVTNNQARSQEIINYLYSVKTDLLIRTSMIQNPKTAYIGSLSKAGHQLITSTSGDYEMFDLVNITNISKINDIHNQAMIDKETLLKWNPEIIFIDANGYELLLEDMSINPSFYQSLNAFKNHQVYLQMPYNFYSTNLEIALLNAYYCGSVLYPEQFNDIDFVQLISEISNFFVGIDINGILIQDYYGGYQALNITSI
ncbi:MAG: hypothetical protein CVV56_05120 [Tenericutes bacterium HGW-Tenericutes-1]|jgi:iron complex transport system substrate-binding protein|nr:MAG: hypothetical protein CVV56_05120 [Tenericutes bacterium HGW-Tenericutes-1]